MGTGMCWTEQDALFPLQLLGAEEVNLSGSSKLSQLYAS